jgi:hypothetical protein
MWARSIGKVYWCVNGNSNNYLPWYITKKYIHASRYLSIMIIRFHAGGNSLLQALTYHARKYFFIAGINAIFQTGELLMD